MDIEKHNKIQRMKIIREWECTTSIILYHWLYYRIADTRHNWQAMADICHLAKRSWKFLNKNNKEQNRD